MPQSSNNGSDSVSSRSEITKASPRKGQPPQETQKPKGNNSKRRLVKVPTARP